MKWPSTRFFQILGLTSFGITSYNLWSGIISRASQKASNNTMKNEINKTSLNVESLGKSVERVEDKINKMSANKSDTETFTDFACKKINELFSNDKVLETAFKNVKTDSENLNKYSDRRGELLEELKNKALSEDQIKNIQDQISQYDNLITKALQSMNKNLELMPKKTDEISSKVIKALEEFNNDKNKWLDNISEQIDNINNFFLSLSHEQNLALFNFSGTFVITITVINILFIFYGNKLLDYFNLEKRYPKIAYFINLRRKFQEYYLLWNTFIIIIVSIIMLIINFLFFIY